MLCKENKLTKILYRFYSTNMYFAVCMFLAVTGVIFGLEVAASAVLILLASGQLAVLSESARMFYPILLVISLVMNLTGTDIRDGEVLFFGIIPFFIAFFYNIIKQKKRFKWNNVFLPMIIVAVSITAGGAFYLSPADYFDISNMFYIVFLGFGMVFTCMLVFTMWDGEYTRTLQYEFIRAIAHSGMLMAFILINYYIAGFVEVSQTHQVLEALAYNPFRNVAVSYYILSMPFVFFCSRKRPVYLLGALFIYAACLASGSRMGLLFGSAEFLICILYFIATSRKRRLLYSAILAAVLIAVLILADDILFFYLGRDELGSGLFRPFESRIAFMRRSISDFFQNPVFGTGLGYRGNEDLYLPKHLEMHWYHNFICQIVGSLGIAGVLSYAYQYYVRLNMLFKRPTSFGWLVCLMYIGILMVSLTDTGIFTPFPTVFLLNCAFMLLAKGLKDKNGVIVEK